jgi:hypothetical protein
MPSFNKGAFLFNSNHSKNALVQFCLHLHTNLNWVWIEIR